MIKFLIKNKLYRKKGIVKINNLFSKYEIINLNSALIDRLIFLNTADYELFEQSGSNKELGRFQMGSIDEYLKDDFIKYFREKNKKFIFKLTKKNMDLSSIVFVKYSGDYGSPNLPPHFDGDNNDLIINYQLDSNIVWDVGINKSVYSLENNSALVFNPNTNIHWRPIVEFKKGDYVKMIFFRFKEIDSENDYSSLSKLMQNDPVFIDTELYRKKVSRA